MDSVCAAPGPVYHERSRRNPLALPRHIGRASDCREMQRSATIKSVTDRGEVAERLKALASKASVRETVPWVRIPPSPPLPLFSCIYKPWCLSWCLLCTGFRPIIGGKVACRHVQTRQRLRQRNSRQYPQKSESRQKLEPLPRRRGA